VGVGGLLEWEAVQRQPGVVADRHGAILGCYSQPRIGYPRLRRRCVIGLSVAQKPRSAFWALSGRSERRPAAGGLFFVVTAGTVDRSVRSGSRRPGQWR
jgi:hypothetical protein